jgi:O-acetylhomoserine (thiol)-lyase
MQFDSTVSTPISSSAAFSYQSSQEAENIFIGSVAKPLYSRMGNPTSSTLEDKLCNMENASACITTSSGMAAVAMAILSICSSDDEIITVGGLFGGCYAFFSQTLPRYKITTTFFSADELDKIESSITSKTKILFCESIGNPNLRLSNIKRLGEIATKHNIIFVVDNTITPLIVRPLENQADIVVYSTTKIISGNSSALGGAVLLRDALSSPKFLDSKYKFLKPFLDNLGSRALYGCMKKRVLRDFGMSSNAHSSYQTILGLETLELRTTRINNSCEVIAKELQEYNINVNHPSLINNIDNALYNTDYKEGCGTMITIDMGSKQKAYQFLDNVQGVILTANIGDTRTLGLHMESTIYRDFNSEEKAYLGITPGLIRISIGIEDPKIIIENFKKAFDITK